MLLTVIAVAAGALVANLYYAQPLIGTIGPQVGISPTLAGAITSVTQIGYGLGLFFLVPLADLVENRRLVLTAVSVTAASLLACGLVGGAGPFFIASFTVGLASTGAQVLLPFAAQLVPEARRGRVVGNMMAGLLAGIMLARPAALFLAGSFGWRSVFWGSAALMAVIGLLLARLLPRHRPQGRQRYGQRCGQRYGHIMVTMVGLLRRSSTLRRRGTYQLLLFGAFNMFWTSVPLMLADRFGMSEHGIALFALAGAGGALAAPLAGRLADRGLSRAASGGAMAVLALAFLALALLGTGLAAGDGAIAVLVVLAVLIDAAVQTNQVVSQRLVFAVPAAMRGRVNAIYMTCLFVGGAIGSTLGTVLYHRAGWVAVAAVGAVIGLGLLLACLAERGPPAPICAEPLPAPDRQRAVV